MGTKKEAQQKEFCAKRTILRAAANAVAAFFAPEKFHDRDLVNLNYVSKNHDN